MDSLEYLKKYLSSDKLEEGKKKLEQGIPVQYIVGNVNFYGYDFIVNKDVLIPRFETETLVEKTIDYINQYFDKVVDIADIGTGSGCIAITMQKELGASVTAVDISEKALDVARENAKNLNCEIEFLKGNMLEPLNKKYDCIISNPPYISEDEEIMDIVKNNEPHIALFASNDGLYFYEEILKNASKYLNKRSIIAFEIGYKQAEKIKKMALKNFKSSKILVEKDLQDRDRFIFIFNK